MQISKSRGEDSQALTRGLRWAAAILLLFWIYAQFSGLKGEPLDLFLLQDRIVSAGAAAALFALSFWRQPLRLGGSARLGWILVIAGAALIMLLLWSGTYLVMSDLPFTGDEHMVLFDAEIFRHGALVAPVAAQWRTFAPALEPVYTLNFPGNANWASAYLPGNAGLRALFSFLLDPALFNPLLVGLGALPLYWIARRLFPESKAAHAVSLLIYATSAQIAVAAMTPYAMTAHLVLNLFWLALFLRGGKLGHAGAAAVGFVATGLHQIVFHPLFALPFLETLRRRRAYSTLGFYLAVYAATGLFWMSYYGFIGGWVGSPPTSGSGMGLWNFVNARILPLLIERDPATLPLMVFNLLRFAAWQNLALLPLLICAVPLARQGKGMAGPLYWGIVLTVAAMFVLLPFQSLGWGYRYVHGVLGNFALLAGYGWQRVQNDRLARPVILFGTGLTLFLAMPYLVWTTRSIVRPSAEASKAIDRIDADFVIVDSDDFGLGRNQVRNDPYLRNRPLRFASQSLRPRDVEALCERGTIAFVSKTMLAGFGVLPDGPAVEKRFGPLAQQMAGRSCVRQPAPT